MLNRVSIRIIKLTTDGTCLRLLCMTDKPLKPFIALNLYVIVKEQNEFAISIVCSAGAKSVFSTMFPPSEELSQTVMSDWEHACNARAIMNNTFVFIVYLYFVFLLFHLNVNLRQLTGKESCTVNL